MVQANRSCLTLIPKPTLGIPVHMKTKLCMGSNAPSPLVNWKLKISSDHPHSCAKSIQANFQLLDFRAITANQYSTINSVIRFLLAEKQSFLLYNPYGKTKKACSAAFYTVAIITTDVQVNV